MSQSCHGCRFFAHGAVIGQCRRFPSIVNKHHTDWCGEFSSVVQREKALDKAQSAVPAANVTIEPQAKRRGRPPKPRPDLV